MPLVTLDEIQGLERYESGRAAFRQHIIALKKNRRVSVGDRVTFVFENHDTVLFQIQEMLRAEHVADLDRVREEVAEYNKLMPGADELSATMLIEITEGDVRAQLVDLIGIDECVRLAVGTRFSIPARFEEGYSREDRLSAVQYVRFHLDGPAREAFCAGTEPARIVIDHANYKAEATLTDGVRASLAHDLAG